MFVTEQELLLSFCFGVWFLLNAALNAEYKECRGYD